MSEFCRRIFPGKLCNIVSQRSIGLSPNGRRITNEIRGQRIQPEEICKWRSSSLIEVLLFSPIARTRRSLTQDPSSSPFPSSSVFARATRLLPGDVVGTVSFYFRVRGALVCYLSSTLTSLLAAIILINISPTRRRAERNRERCYARVSPYVFLQQSTTLRTFLGLVLLAAGTALVPRRTRQNQKQGASETRTERGEHHRALRCSSARFLRSPRDWLLPSPSSSVI